MDESARYHVRHIDRVTSPSGHSEWRLAFLRIGSPGETIEVTVHSAVFASMDLDAAYTAEDLMRMNEPGLP